MFCCSFICKIAYLISFLIVFGNLGWYCSWWMALYCIDRWWRGALFMSFSNLLIFNFKTPMLVLIFVSFEMRFWLCMGMHFVQMCIMNFVVTSIYYFFSLYFVDAWVSAYISSFYLPWASFCIVVIKPIENNILISYC